VQEQEDRQRAFQEEYRQKAIREAYESLRVAQQKYYDLMGVAGEAGQGRPQARAAAQVPMGSPTPPTQYPAAGAAPGRVQQYPQAPAGPTMPAQARQQMPPASGGYPVAAAPGSGGYTVGAPPGQATPLTVQDQGQQQTGSGFWSTLKEIFLPPAGVAPSPRGMFDRQSKDPIN
jgi:hypothetical protein